MFDSVDGENAAEIIFSRMNKTTIWLATISAFLAGILIAFAGSTSGARISGVSIYVLIVVGTFALQWLSFLPSWIQRTEKFFDLMGSVGFLLAAWVAITLSGTFEVRAVIVAGCVTVWAARLGLFLTNRIIKSGSDRRFDKIKQNFSLFFMTWTLQALWITVTSSAALVVLTSLESSFPIDAWLLVGVSLWLTGFTIEATADWQKSRFNQQPKNEHKFISSGLWAWSQHPNYFGEIILWIGIAVIAFPSMRGWQFITLVSPLFVWLLLTRISGIRMLDEGANKRWGNNPDYKQYVHRTPKLIPWPPRL